MEAQRIPVSEKALTQRINRALKTECQRLHKSRSHRDKSLVGDWYVTDSNTNTVVSCHIDLEQFGREAESLAPHEYLAD